MDGNNSPVSSQVAMVGHQAGTVEELASSSSSGGVPPMDSDDDWRAQLPLDLRPPMVDTIMETLKKHQFSVQEGLQGLKNIAERYEEKIYSAATSQSDYLRKISLMMTTLETNSQNPMANSLQGLKVQRIPGGGQVPMVQPQAGTVEQLTSSSSGAASTMDPNDWRAQLPLDSRQWMVDTIMESMKKLLPFPGEEKLRKLKEIAVRYEEKIYSIATSQSDYLRNISLKMLTAETISRSTMANYSQTGAADASRNSSDIASNNMQSQIHNPGLTMPIVSGQSQGSQNMQNNTSVAGVQNSCQQTTQLKLGQQPQPQQAQGVPIPHQQQTSMAQQPMMQTAHQTLTGQVSSDSGIQQNNIQALKQQFGLMSMQHNIANLQQQQLMISQLNSIPNMHQQRQMGGGVSGLQQSTVLGMPSNQHSVHMLQQKVPVQQQMQQNVSFLQNQTQQPQPSQQQMVSQSQVQQQMQQNVSFLQNQTQQPQPQPSQQQMVSQSQPRSGQMQHLQRDMQQWLPTSGAMFQQQNLVQQQNQFCQSQQAMQEASSNSTAQTGNADAEDWREEAYQKIKSMKDVYLQQLNEMYHRSAVKLQQHDALIGSPTNEQLSKLKFFNVMLERLVQFLRLSKDEIQIDHKDKLDAVEKQITNILNLSNRPRPQTQPLNQQTSATTMAPNNLSAIHQNTSSYVPSISNPLISSLQQPSSSLQNSSLLSRQQVAVNFLEQNNTVSGPQSVNLACPLITGTPLLSAKNPFIFRSPTTHVAPSPNVNTGHIQAPNVAGSSSLSLAPGHPSPHVNQQNLMTSLTKSKTPLPLGNSPVIAMSPSTPVTPSPVHATSERVNPCLSSHPKTDTGLHLQAPNAAGTSVETLAISINGESENVTSLEPNTNGGHLQAPNAAGSSSVLPLSISIGGSEIVNATLSSQPNTHIIHLQAPNPAGPSAKPLAISIKITIA